LKKLVNIGTWAFLALVFTVLWGFTSSEQGSIICSNLHTWVDPTNGNHFVNKHDIEVELGRQNLHPVGKKSSDIDLNELENKLENIAEVKKATVYRNINGDIHISVLQRTPIVRVMNANGSQFYLDEDGFQMPLSENYSPRVPIVTGHINDPYMPYSALEIADNKTLAPTVKSDEVFKLVSFIRKNEFWNAQIQQINFNRHGDIELIPTVGDHLIIFGDLESMEQKLNKLKIFYKGGLNHLDWTLYDTVNVKFRHQIICTKK